MAPVTPDEVRLRTEPVVDEGDVLHMDHGSIHVPNGDIVQVIEDLRAAVDRDVVFAHPDFRRACGQDDVLSEDRIGDVLRRQSPRVESVGVDVNVHHAHLAAIGQRDGCALDGDELGADEAVAQVVELLFRQLIAAQARQEDGNAGGVVLENLWWKDSGGQRPHDLLCLGVHLRDGRLDRHIGMEVQPRDGHSTERHGFDVLDPVHGRGEGPLTDSDDSTLHFGRGQPGVVPDDGDDRNVDGGEDVHGHGRDGHDAQDGDQQGEDDERVGAAKGEPDDPHGGKPPYMFPARLRPSSV